MGFISSLIIKGAGPCITEEKAVFYKKILSLRYLCITLISLLLTFCFINYLIPHIYYLNPDLFKDLLWGGISLASIVAKLLSQSVVNVIGGVGLKSRVGHFIPVKDYMLLFC